MNSCALSNLVDFGSDKDYLQRHYEPGGEYREPIEADLRKKIEEFDASDGQFKPLAFNAHACPKRSGLLVNINEHQKPTWHDLLTELGFTEIWSFVNAKGGNRIHLYARAKDDCA